MPIPIAIISYETIVNIDYKEKINKTKPMRKKDKMNKSIVKPRLSLSQQVKDKYLQTIKDPITQKIEDIFFNQQAKKSWILSI